MLEPLSEIKAIHGVRKGTLNGASSAVKAFKPCLSISLVLLCPSLAALQGFGAWRNDPCEPFEIPARLITYVLRKKAHIQF